MNRRQADGSRPHGPEMSGADDPPARGEGAPTTAPLPVEAARSETPEGGAEAVLGDIPAPRERSPEPGPLQNRRPPGDVTLVGRARFAAGGAGRTTRLPPGAEESLAVGSAWRPRHPLVLSPHAPGGYVLGDGAAPVDPGRPALTVGPEDSAELLYVSAGVVVALVRFEVGRPPVVLRCPVGAWASLFRETA